MKADERGSEWTKGGPRVGDKGRHCDSLSRPHRQGSYLSEVPVEGCLLVSTSIWEGQSTALSWDLVGSDASREPCRPLWELQSHELCNLGDVP